MSARDPPNLNRCIKINHSTPTWWWWRHWSWGTGIIQQPVPRWRPLPRNYSRHCSDKIHHGGKSKSLKWQFCSYDSLQANTSQLSMLTRMYKNYDWPNIQTSFNHRLKQSYVHQLKTKWWLGSPMVKTNWHNLMDAVGLPFITDTSGNINVAKKYI